MNMLPIFQRFTDLNLKGKRHPFPQPPDSFQINQPMRHPTVYSSTPTIFPYEYEMCKRTMKKKRIQSQYEITTEMHAQRLLMLMTKTDSSRKAVSKFERFREARCRSRSSGDRTRSSYTGTTSSPTEMQVQQRPTSGDRTRSSYTTSFPLNRQFQQLLRRKNEPNDHHIGKNVHVPMQQRSISPLPFRSVDCPPKHCNPMCCTKSKEAIEGPSTTFKQKIHSDPVVQCLDLEDASLLTFEENFI